MDRRHDVSVIVFVLVRKRVRSPLICSRIMTCSSQSSPRGLECLQHHGRARK